ncbi:general secretion pathway protein K [Hydrogenivirga caldilitoris]|uniref:General secretion pathway protein K n=1 Tax=Hydrogenivirga caldilitoris TaxID=246264 RepID=A0A497XS67_9AQUI|nr:general secretion pathway protein K [Hydrogenivirga caldilitoris]
MLSFFLLLSGYVVSTLQSTSSTINIVEKVYKKQQSYHALLSLLPYIIQSLKSEDASYDALSDPWAMPFAVQTEKGSLEVVIYDEDRFLNLNKVGEDPLYREVFERLLNLLGVSQGYTDRLLAWIGKEPKNFESEYPLKRAPMDSPEELEFLGMKRDELYGKTEGDISYPGVLSLVTTYSSGKINVNTAPKYILMALDPGIDSSLADRIIEYRAKKPFKSINDLVLVEGMSFDILYRIQKVIDVKSSFFRLKETVKTGDVETTLEVVYDRSKNEIVYKRLY